VLNRVERLLAGIAPGWGLRRLTAKTALAHAEVIAERGYDAARRDRRTEDWRATGGSAAGELGPALDIIRRRSRDLIRNNEWAANGKRKLVAHIVGSGIVPRPADGTAKANKRRATDLWKSFVETCDTEGVSDYYGKQAQIIGEVVEGGACFVRWFMRPPERGLKVPLQFQVLEHEFLDITKTGEFTKGVLTLMGVDYDADGRRVAYWLFPKHPGEQGYARRSMEQSERHDASMVDHVFRQDRPGLPTGVPWFSPILLRLRDAGDYEEAEIIRKKLEACLTLIVKKDGNANPLNLAQPADQKAGKDGRRLERLSPGLIAYLGAGEDVETVMPTPAGGYVEHLKQQLRAAAAGAGLTYEQFSGDLSGVNYSSIREGKLDFWGVLDQWQWHMAIPQMCAPAWRRVMQAAAGRGHAVPGDLAAEWSVPKRPWVDPWKDIQAEGMELLLGLESWPDKVAGRGYDPEDRLALLAELAPKLKEAGVSFGGPAPNTQAAAQDGAAAPQN
jgi:lambda family phage portal protein